MSVSTVSSTPGTSTNATQAPPASSATATAAKPGAALISALGGGSGVNVSALAQNLVDAERAPQKAIIDKAIQSSQARISGYGAVLSSLSAFKSSLSALQDKSQFNALYGQSNASGYFDVTTDATAKPGNHKISVLTLASGQTSTSGGFSSADAGLNSGASIALNLTVGGNAITPAINVTASGTTGPSANDMVAAINNAAAGITARIVDTGSSTERYKIVLSSTGTGSGSSFSVSTTAKGEDGITALDFSTNVQAVSDARIVVNGVSMVRASNNISDAIQGVTLNLLAPTTPDGTAANSTAASISFSRDTTSIKSGVQALVDAFNSTKKLLGAVSDGKSTDPNGATLVNDSLVRKIGMQLSGMVTGYSSTPGPEDSQGKSVSALRDIGVTIQRDGTLALDSAKLDSALITKFTDVVKMLTGNQENSKGILPGNRGLAGDAVKQLTNLMGPNGPIVNASNTATSNISTQNRKQVDLELKMQGLLTQYMSQFTVMDNIVGQMNSLKVSLSNQFTAWANQKN
jgi:flagellar hook-associated protein 2